MSRDDAIPRALAMHPDIPGVGRLCQELLSDVTGQAIRTPTIELLDLKGALSIRNGLNGRRKRKST